MRLIELITDPTSNQLSMSRLGLAFILVMDIAWATCAIAGVTPSNLVSPVSTMLAAVTGAVAGIYGVNSFGGAWRGGSISIAVGDEPPEETRPPVKPRQSGGS